MLVFVKAVPLTLSMPIRLNLSASIPVTDTPPSGPKLLEELFAVAAAPEVDVLVALKIPAVFLTPFTLSSEVANDSLSDPLDPETT